MGLGWVRAGLLISLQDTVDTLGNIMQSPVRYVEA